MAQRIPRYQTFLNMMVLVGFGWAAILIELAPLDGLASALPSPDLLFCVSACLMLRRPNAAPILVIGILGIVRDLLGGGPAGLGALLLIAALEILRNNRSTILRRGLFLEILSIAVLSAMMAAIQVIMLTVTLTPTPPLDQLATGILITVAAYFLVLFLFRVILRIRAEHDDRPGIATRAVR